MKEFKFILGISIQPVDIGIPFGIESVRVGRLAIILLPSIDFNIIQYLGFGADFPFGK